MHSANMYISYGKCDKLKINKNYQQFYIITSWFDKCEDKININHF